MLKRYLGAIADLALFTSASAGQAEDFLEIKGFMLG
jgi:hypothetical protein